MAALTGGKKPSRKSTWVGAVWSKEGWTVKYGELKRGAGRPGKVAPLFNVVAEKLPYGALGDVARRVKDDFDTKEGVYIAHDSMGYARYVGRGQIFARLKQHLKAHPRELHYFSFYIAKDKTHEREIESLLIRAGGPHLHFNTRKRRIDIEAGDVRDFEPGTAFFERQMTPGRKKG